MSYYIVEEVLGYTINFIDEANPAPKGVEIFESDADLQAAVERNEARVVSELDSFETIVTTLEVNTDPVLDDLKLLSTKEMANKYLLKDANRLAKAYNLKRPKVSGKNVKEEAYWQFLKDELI